MIGYVKNTKNHPITIKQWDGKTLGIAEPGELKAVEVKDFPSAATVAAIYVVKESE